MKIVIASSRPYHLMHLARELAENGHEVVIFGYMPEFKIINYNPGEAVYKNLFTPLLPYSALALQRRFLNIQRYATHNLFVKVDELVVKLMPACDVFIGLSGVIVKAFQHAKQKYQAVTICERGSSHILTQKENMLAANLDKYFTHYMQRELAAYAAVDYICLPSIYAKNSFIEHGTDNNKIFVNNYGVDLQRFKLPHKPNNNTNIRILYVGNWSYRKGCDILKNLLNHHQDITLTHIGKQGDIDFPENPRFKSLGHIENIHLPKFYSEHDLFMFLSRDDGFGMVLLEALAANLPLITSRYCGGLDIKQHLSVSEKVTVIDDLNDESVNKALQQFRQQRELINRVPLSEHEFQHYSWREYGIRYSHFLDNALKVKYAASMA